MLFNSGVRNFLSDERFNLADEQEATAPHLKRCDKLLFSIEAIHQALNLLTDGISLQGDLEDFLGLDKLDIPDVQSQLKELRAIFREFKDTEPFKNNQRIMDLRNELRRDIGRLSLQTGRRARKESNHPSIQTHPDKGLYKLQLINLQWQTS